MDQEKMQRIVEKWKVEYDKAIPRHLEDLQTLLDAMKQNMSVETLKPFRLAVHKMCGSAGTVGYTKVSEICKKYDQELGHRLETFHEILDKSHWIAEYQEYLEEIKRAFQNY